MKQRLVIIIGMILFALTIGVIDTNAQEIVVNGDTIAQVTDTEFEALFDKYTAKASTALTGLVSSVKDNLTDEAQFVWGMYVKVYKMKWFLTLGLCLFGLVLFSLGFPAWTFAKKNDDYSPSDTPQGVVAIAAWIIGAFMFLICAIVSIANITYLIVPEYHVIQDLIGLVKH